MEGVTSGAKKCAQNITTHCLVCMTVVYHMKEVTKKKKIA